MTNKTQALYRSSNSSYVQVGDVLGKFLAAASKLSLKVLVGLQLIRMTNVSEVAALYQTLAADLHAGYGHEASFRGFYLTQEWGPTSHYLAEDMGREFLGPLSDAVHMLDPSLQVGLSPSLSDVLTWGPCQAAWYSSCTPLPAPVDPRTLRFLTCALRLRQTGCAPPSRS